MKLMVEFFMLSCRGYDNYDLGSKSDTNVYMYTFSKDSFYGFFVLLLLYLF